MENTDTDKQTGAELLKVVYEQHELHARHVENERLWFTNIFGVIVAGLLAFLGTVETDELSQFAKLTGSFIFTLSVLGYMLCLTWRVPFVTRTEQAERMLRTYSRLQEYTSYPPKYRTIKLFWISAHELFLYFYALMAGGGAFVVLHLGLRYPHWWVAFVPTALLLLSWRGLRLPWDILMWLSFRPLVTLLLSWNKPRPERNRYRSLRNARALAIRRRRRALRVLRARKTLRQGLLGREDDFRDRLRYRGSPALRERPFFRKGTEALELFEGEKIRLRGIRRRIKHDFDGLLLHDAELTPQLQAGHRHTTLREAIMLLDGEVEACAWDDTGRIETKLLSEWGDLAVFPPERNHTLFVKRDSRIIVIRFSTAGPEGDSGERIPVPLPGRLQELRSRSIEPSGLTDNLREEIEQELVRRRRS